MKITIENFGPIKQFHYDLTKDIIVTFGDNNIGKSYAMQVVYLLLKNLTEYAGFNNGYYRYSYSTQMRYFSEHFDEIRETIEKFSKSQEYTLDITKLINSVVLLDLSEKFISNFSNSCENTFGNFKGIIEQNPIIILEIGKYSLKISFADDQPLQASIYTSPTYIKRTTSDFHKSRNANGRVDIYYYKDDTEFDQYIQSSVTHARNLYRVFNGSIRELTNGKCPTLTASMCSPRNAAVLKDDYGVRRLTLRECLRFQGFPELFF